MLRRCTLSTIDDNRCRDQKLNFYLRDKIIEITKAGLNNDEIDKLFKIDYEIVYKIVQFQFIREENHSLFYIDRF
jgi:hypothetical protein